MILALAYVLAVCLWFILLFPFLLGFGLFIDMLVVPTIRHFKERRR